MSDESQKTAWERCTKGSCHRHQDCMYTPCRAVKVSEQKTPGERYLEIAWVRANGRRKSRSPLFPPLPRELTKGEREEISSIIDAAIAAERERCAKIADEYGANAKEERSVWAAEAIAGRIRGVTR